MAKLFANSEDSDQTPCSAASDLALHCLPVTLLRVSRLQWVKPGMSLLQALDLPAASRSGPLLPTFIAKTFLNGVSQIGFF